MSYSYTLIRVTPGATGTITAMFSTTIPAELSPETEGVLSLGVSIYDIASRSLAENLALLDTQIQSCIAQVIVDRTKTKEWLDMAASIQAALDAPSAVVAPPSEETA